MKIKRNLLISVGLGLVMMFAVWTVLIQVVDVQSIGANGTDIGFATVNWWFHSLTGVNMVLYDITDWLGLVPVFACIMFAFVGFIQLVKRKSLRKVDFDIIILGIYYLTVIIFYLFFETVPINYRPVLIDGVLEASYPSSTTLLVLCVMPTVVLQSEKRLKNKSVKSLIFILSVLFILFTVIGRILSGVHWLTDIIGSVLLSAGLFIIYTAVVGIKQDNFEEG